jgi:serine O-acetyltransferase
MDASLVRGVHLMNAAPLGEPAHHKAEIPSLRAAIQADLEEMAKVKGCPYPSASGLLDVLTIPGTWAVLLFRFANTAHYRGLRPLSRFLFFLNVVLFGIELHPSAIIGPGLVIPHPVGVAIGGECRVGKRALLFRHVGIGGLGDPKRPGQPVLGDDVVVFDSASIFGPIHVGDRSMVGTRALVSDDVEPDVFVFGVRKSTDVRPLAEMGFSRSAAPDLAAAEPAAEMRIARLLPTEPVVSTEAGVVTSNGQVAKAG